MPKSIRSGRNREVFQTFLDSEFVEDNPLTTIILTQTEELTPEFKAECPDGAYRELCAYINWIQASDVPAEEIRDYRNSSEVISFDFQDWLSATRQNNSTVALKTFRDLHASQLREHDGVDRRPLSPAIARERALNSLVSWVEENGSSIAFRSALKEVVKRLAGGPWKYLVDALKVPQAGDPNWREIIWRPLMTSHDSQDDMDSQRAGQQNTIQTPDHVQYDPTWRDPGETARQIEADRRQREMFHSQDRQTQRETSVRPPVEPQAERAQPSGEESSHPPVDVGNPD